MVNHNMAMPSYNNSLLQQRLPPQHRKVNPGMGYNSNQRMRTTPNSPIANNLFGKTETNLYKNQNLGLSQTLNNPLMTRPKGSISSQHINETKEFQMPFKPHLVKNQEEVKQSILNSACLRRKSLELNTRNQMVHDKQPTFNQHLDTKKMTQAHMCSKSYSVRIPGNESINKFSTPMKQLNNHF